MSAKLWKEFECSVCSSHVNVPFIFYEDLCPEVSARPHDAGAGFWLGKDGISSTGFQQVCPRCMRSGETPQSNGAHRSVYDIDRLFGAKGSRGDVLHQVLTALNEIKLSTEVAETLCCSLWNHLRDGKFGYLEDNDNWYNFEEEVGNYRGEVADVSYGARLCVHLVHPELGAGEFAGYYWDTWWYENNGAQDYCYVYSSESAEDVWNCAFAMSQTLAAQIQLIANEVLVENGYHPLAIVEESRATA